MSKDIDEVAIEEFKEIVDEHVNDILRTWNPKLDMCFTCIYKKPEETLEMCPNCNNETLHLQNDYISLTDIAKKREGEYPGYVIQNWLRNKATVAFVGLWESIHNPNFNCIEFEAIKSEAGTNSFVLTPKRWVETTNAIGIVTKSGRYAATYAHKDIAFEFASWIYLAHYWQFVIYLPCVFLGF